MSQNIHEETYHVHAAPYEDEFAPFWDADDPRQEKLHYLLYEEEVDVEVDLDTGKHRIIGFAGKALAEPTEWQ
jgi:hypothetical protein